MNELISVIYQSDRPTVSGRELWKALEVETPYHKWFSRMAEYGFVEGRDFNSDKFVQVQNEGGRTVSRKIIDHQLTIPMAKEICMLQRSEMGRQFRRYFISIEEAWNSPEKIMERALAIAHQKALEAEQRIFALNAENQELSVALNTSLDYWTVMKYNTEKGKHWNMSQCQSVGRRMAAYCRINGFEVKSCMTNDDRFSCVNSYPVTAWEHFMNGGGNGNVLS